MPGVDLARVLLAVLVPSPQVLAMVVRFRVWVRRRNVGAYPGLAAVRAARALPRHALASASRRK